MLINDFKLVHSFGLDFDALGILLRKELRYILVQIRKIWIINEGLRMSFIVILGMITWLFLRFLLNVTILSTEIDRLLMMRVID